MEWYFYHRNITVNPEKNIFLKDEEEIKTFSDKHEENLSPADQHYHYYCTHIHQTKTQCAQYTTKKESLGNGKNENKIYFLIKTL